MRTEPTTFRANTASLPTSQRGVLERDSVLGYIFLAPVALLLLLLVAYPLVHSVLLSLQNRQLGTGNAEFVWFANYIALFQDPLYLRSLANTAIFTVGSVAVKLVLGLLTALALNQPIPGRNVMRGVVLLPWALPTVVTLVIWGWMYNDMFGILNFVLFQVGVIEQPINWLGDPATAMASVIAVNIWRGFPFFALILLAGLQSIPADLYEAANVDGAGKWQRFRDVTLPGVLTVLMIVTLLSTILTVNEFAVVWVLTKGGPGHATSVLATYTFDRAFFARELSYGVTVAMTMLPLLLTLILLLVRFIARREQET